MVTLSVGLAVAGLLVLTVCAIRVHAAVQGLARQIRRTRDLLTAGQEGLERELRLRE